jgi:hypothetical protein
MSDDSKRHSRDLKEVADSISEEPEIEQAKLTPHPQFQPRISKLSRQLNEGQ